MFLLLNFARLIMYVAAAIYFRKNTIFRSRQRNDVINHQKENMAARGKFKSKKSRKQNVHCSNHLKNYRLQSFKTALQNRQLTILNKIVF